MQSHSRSRIVSLGLLVFLFGSVLCGGLREPGLWAPAAAAFWALAARTPPDRSPRWAAWLGWLVLSAAFSGQVLPALAPMSRWAAAAAFALLASHIWEERDRRAWALGVMAVGGLAAAAAVFGVRGLSTYYNARDVQELTVGLFAPYYNYTAFAALAGAAAAVGWLAHPEGRRGWPALLAAASLVSAGLFAARTSPRAAFLAFLAASAAALLRRGLWKLLALGALVLAGSAVAFKGPALARLLKRDRDAVAKRPQLWAAAARVVKDHPLLGVGPGNFETGFRVHNFRSRYRVTDYQFSTAYAHSEPLQAAAETGVVGLMLLLLALSSLASWPRPGPPQTEAALASALAMSVQLLADNMVHVPAFLLLYLSAWAAARAPEPGGRPVRFWRPACAFAALLAFAAWAGGGWTAELARRAERGDLEAARAWVRALPLEAPAWEALARNSLLAAEPRIDRALSALAEAERLSPKNALYPVRAAELFRILGRWEEAALLARRGVELEPNFLQARLLLAEAAARRGDLPAAAFELAEAQRRRGVLEAAGVYMGSRALYTGYDLTVTSFDEERAKLVRSLIESPRKRAKRNG